MVSQRYRNAMTELLEYLKGIDDQDIAKIPKQLMNFFEANASRDYICNFDYNKPLKELELLDETRGLISMICLNYWCETEEQKRTYINKLNENELKYQEELRKKYNPNDLFRNNKITDIEVQDSKETQLIEYKKETIINKVITKLREMLTNLKRML